MRTPSRLLRPRPASALLASLAVGAAVAMGAPSAAAPPPSGAAAPSAAPAGQPARSVPVRLITGEVLHVTDRGDGVWAVDRVAGDSAGAAAGSFVRYVDAAGDLHVFPSDLLPLIGSVLDPRLFDVSALIRDGLAGRAELPVIVSFTGADVAVPGLETDRRLPSIGAVAGTLDDDGSRELRTALSTAAKTGSTLAGVERIWLDGAMHTSLDESVPQIGAPEAWERGFQGSGVTIGVVDTGVDAGHPDLAGRVVESEVFAEGAGTDDVIGHGTHVASIAAGSGAASGDQFVGVAYGADIVSAKVFDDDGFAQESWVIAGMEWAAENADIVNMSINGGPTDGTDLVSQAVDALSASQDVLFVTSAGNFGPGAETVETPATAASALAVGATDKSDQMAFFSAQGPRLGGTLVKPEIVAPGMDITAARADGAEIGEPVGEDYMILSGTSMASPHVAGAAALLLQANPDWSWSQLKNALVTSANRLGGSAYVEGGGRVDVPAALDQTVRADVATIDLGRFAFPHDDGETSTAEVTLTNDGEEEVVLDLSVDAQTAEGEAAPPEMITTDTDQLVLAPGASGVVTVTADPATGPSGPLGGALVATQAGEPAVHVPLGFEKEVEMVDLTIDVIDRQGGHDLSTFGLAFNLDNGEIIDFFQDPGQPPVVLRVEPGPYAVLTNGAIFDEDSFELDVLNQPEIIIEDATTLVLDARDAVQTRYELDTELSDFGIDVGDFRYAETTGLFVGASIAEVPDIRVYALPTEPVTIGEYGHSTMWTSFGPDAEYVLFFPEPGQIPEDQTYELTEDDLAQTTMHYASDTEREYAVGRAVGNEQFGTTAWLFPRVAPGSQAFRVTTEDQLSSGAIFVVDFDAGLFLDFSRPLAALEGGQQTEETWLSRPVRPALPGDFYPPTRFEDFLYVGLAGFVDPEGSYGYADPVIDTVSFVLSADGEVLAESDQTFLEVEAPAEPTTYELVLETARDLPDWWQTSPTTRTVWSFESEHADGEVPLELLQVDYDVELDMTNTVPGWPFMITFRPYDLAEQFPVAASVDEITDFTAQWSVDDGETWSDVRELVEQDGSWVGGIGVPPECLPECFVSLRVSAVDDGGATMQQMISRAFRATYIEPTATPTSPEPTTTETVTTTPVPTTTLPNTGAGGIGGLAVLGLLALLAGGGLVGAASVRLRRTPTISG